MPLQPRQKRLARLAAVEVEMDDVDEPGAEAKMRRASACGVGALSGTLEQPADLQQRAAPGSSSFTRESPRSADRNGPRL